MVKQKRYTFTVTSTGPFPVDMLRYDRCWPKTESESAYHIAQSFQSGAPRVVRAIVLMGLNRPTMGRWHSFGWEVTDVRESTELV